MSFCVLSRIFQRGLFDAKEKSFRMEWTLMQEKKNHIKTLFRVIRAYKKPMLLGLFLGISLVIGDLLVNQFITGNENIPITLAKMETKSSQLENDTSQSEDQIVKETMETENKQGTENIGNGNDTNDFESNNSDQAQTVNGSNDFNDEETVSTINKKHFTVLLVGVDQRPGEKSFSNTDTLLVANINTVNGQVSLISIPRDTQVNIPGYGKEKINAAARLGEGLKTTKALVEELTGQPIDGYVLTNFKGFKTMIDTLGGVTLTIEKDMYYVTGDAEDGIINLKKGTQRLNGTQALQYARFRQDALADISRTSRQQAVLKAMQKELLQVKTLPKLPGLISQLNKSMETDLSVGELWSLANIMNCFKNPEIISQTLPGNFLIEDDISYWRVNPLKSHSVVKRLIEEGKTTSVFFQQT